MSFSEHQVLNCYAMRSEGSFNKVYEFPLLFWYKMFSVIFISLHFDNASVTHQMYVHNQTQTQVITSANKVTTVKWNCFLIIKEGN